MNQEMTPFDYAGLSDEAGELCKIVEIRIKTRTGMTIFENGQDLLAVKEKIGHGKFIEWLNSWFPKSETTAQEWMQVAREYKDKSPIIGDLGAACLQMLARKSTPVDVRQNIEARAVAGEKIDVAMVKAEIAAARAEAAAANELLNIQKAETAEKQEKASRRESNLIEKVKEAEKEKITAIAEAGLKAQAALADRIANAEAREKAALELATETTRNLDAAVAKAKADAEQAARDNADALAAAALAKTKAEAEKWEDKAAAALRRNEGYSSALSSLQTKVKEHQDLVARISSDQYDAMTQLKYTDEGLLYLNVSMVTLVDFEDALPHPSAIPKLDRMRQMHSQIALALESFLARKANHEKEHSLRDIMSVNGGTP